MIKFNTHEDAANYVSKVTNELVDVAMYHIAQLDKEQQWLIYARVVNSLFHRCYAPTIYHTHKVNTDTEDKLNGQFTKPKSKYKTKRFKTK